MRKEGGKMALRVSDGKMCPLQGRLQTPAKVRLRQGMQVMDSAVDRLKPGWKREALRAAWFLCDAVVREDEGGLVLAETVIQQRRG